MVQCSLGFTLVKFGLMRLLAFTWVQLNPLWINWVNLGSLGFTLVYFGSPGLTWAPSVYLGSLGFI